MKPRDRAKFNLNELVIEMLDKIPEEIFSSPTTTFLDPTFAGGQFLIEIVKKLKLYGHSDENIKSRVFGYEDNIWYVLYVKRNKYLQLANLDVKLYTEFFEDKKLPKFDVVIGNPPYQASGAFKGSSILWPDFIKTASKIIKPKGFISIIHPYTWMSSIKKESRSSKPVLQLIKKSNLIEINLTPHKYFNVGSSTICYFILQYNSEQKATNLIYENFKYSIDNIFDYDFLPMSVTNKLDFSILEKTLFLENCEKFDIISGGGHRKKEDNQEKTKSYKYKIAYTWSNFRNKKYLWSKTPGILQTERKVIAFYSSNCNFVYDDGKFGLGEMTFGIKVADKKQGNNLINILDSKLYKFISKFKPYSGTHGGRPATLKHLPKLDLSKNWSDGDLYKFFGLTREEINFIEKQVDDFYNK